MTSFFRVWLSGYAHPAAVGTKLADKTAPHWGLYGQGLRALMDALLLYLPLALLGWQPSTPSYLTFVPTERYYAALVLFAPIFLFAQWLLLAVVLHVVLRLLGRPSNMDQIINLTGMAALIVGAFLVVWDWSYVLLGGRSDVFLGITHLLADIWAIIIVTAGLKKLLGVPIGLGIVLNVLWIALGVPMAMVFMRGPV